MLIDFEKNVDYEYATFGRIKLKKKKKANWEYVVPPVDHVDQ